MADKKISQHVGAGRLYGSDGLLLSKSGADARTNINSLRNFVNPVTHADGVGPGDIGEWVRPYDWLPMPTPVIENADMLCAVFPYGDCTMRFRIHVDSSTTFSVDWGDGSAVEVVASNNTVSHTFNYSGCAGSECHRGYRQALVKAYPTTPGDTIAFMSNVAGAVSDFLLEFQFNSIGSIQDCSAAALVLERINIVACEIGTSLPVGLAGGNQNLRSFSYPSGYFSLVTGAGTAFHTNNYLKTITFSSGMLANATTIQQMFTNCKNLNKVTFESGSIGTSVLDMYFMFANCLKLTEVVFPGGGALANAGTGGGSVSAMFTNCWSLKRIQNCQFYQSFSVAGCNLNAAALNEIYTALPTVSGKTIEVYNNPGVKIGPHDPTIATAKGWTVDETP